MLSLSAGAILVFAPSAVSRPSGAAEPSHLVGTIAGLQSAKSETEMIPARNFISKMLKATDAMGDYSFKFTMQVFKGKKTVVEKGNFYFKQPRLMRLEETGSYKKGSVAVLTDSGRVKAHMGGTFSFFVVDLPADSGLLRSANGHPMIESDFKSLASALQSYIDKGMSATVTKDPVQLAGHTSKVHIVEIRKSKNAASKASESVWKRIAVDPEKHIPLQWWDYDDKGKLWSHAKWETVAANQNLPDKLFSIKGGKRLDDSKARQLMDGKNGRSSPKEG